MSRAELIIQNFCESCLMQSLWCSLPYIFYCEIELSRPRELHIIIMIQVSGKRRYPMHKRSYITIGLGVALIIMCLLFMFRAAVISPSGIIGLALIYTGWKGDRKAMVILGHAPIVVGAYLITWGLYLLPVSNPSLMGILGKPLFWGIFCLFGGICSIFHGFCACVRNFKVDKSDS